MPMTKSFRIKTLLLGTLIAAGVMGVYRYYRNAYAPIQWRTYSEQAAEQSLQNGSLVLVRFSARWDASSIAGDLIVFTDSNVRYLINTNDVVPYMADMTDRNPEGKKAFKRYPQTSDLNCVLFLNPRTKEEHVVAGTFDAEDFLTELSQQLAK